MHDSSFLKKKNLKASFIEICAEIQLIIENNVCSGTVDIITLCPAGGLLTQNNPSFLPYWSCYIFFLKEWRNLIFNFFQMELQLH